MFGKLSFLVVSVFITSNYIFSSPVLEHRFSSFDADFSQEEHSHHESEAKNSFLEFPNHEMPAKINYNLFKENIRKISKKNSYGVAVIDRGFIWDHPALENTYYDSQLHDNQKTHFHGGHISSIIKSLHPNTKIYPISIENLNDYNAIFNAFEEIAETKKKWLMSKGKNGHGIVAINLSFGVSKKKCTEHNLIWNTYLDQLLKIGILTIAATSNSHFDVDVEGDIPTSCTSNGLIGVGNTNLQGQWLSAWGKRNIDISAPGFKIYGPINDKRMGYLSGTSQAAPMVSGAIAAIIEESSQDFKKILFTNPELSALWVRALILETARNLPQNFDKILQGRSLAVFEFFQKIEELF